MANEVSPKMPNPLTPLAWLPPDTAFQLFLSQYLYCGTLRVYMLDISTLSYTHSEIVQVWIWDILVSIPDEYRMCKQHKVGFPTMVYFLSRYGISYFIS